MLIVESVRGLLLSISMGPLPSCTRETRLFTRRLARMLVHAPLDGLRAVGRRDDHEEDCRSVVRVEVRARVYSVDGAVASFRRIHLIPPPTLEGGHHNVLFTDVFDGQSSCFGDDRMTAALLHLATSSVTLWAAISPLLPNEPDEYLPAVPSAESASALYGRVASTFSRGSPFASYTVRVDADCAAPTETEAVADPHICVMQHFSSCRG